MKQKFFLSLLALGVTVLSASATPEPERLVLTVGNVEHLSIEDNIDVILIQGAPDNSSLIMDQNTSDKLSLKLSNKKLVIASQSGATKKQKFIVYVYVNKLKTITVDGESQIKTFGSLNSAKLELYVGGDAHVHVRNNGEIKAYSFGDSEIDIQYLTDKTVAKRAY